jgi:CheY-like chemotaxis protein
VAQLISENQPISVPTRRILIVDDNRDAAESLAMMLSADGHETHAVFSSQDALNEAITFLPDMILLDIGLPEMDGYEVARRLRHLPSLDQLRIVALTGYGQASDIARAKAAGFDGHLVKPIDFDALARAIASAPFAK